MPLFVLALLYLRVLVIVLPPTLAATTNFVCHSTVRFVGCRFQFSLFMLACNLINYQMQMSVCVSVCACVLLINKRACKCVCVCVCTKLSAIYIYEF